MSVCVLALEPPMKVCELMSVFSSTRGYDRIRIELRIMIKFGFRFWFLVSDIFSVLVLCHKPFEVYCLCHNFSSSVVFKPGSSGQSRMAPSPLLCLSLSWREPSGKSSSPRLSKKKKKLDWSTVWPLSLAFLLPTSPGSFPDHQNCCHLLSYCFWVSVASPQHPSSLSFFSSSSHLFARTTDSAS